MPALTIPSELTLESILIVNVRGGVQLRDAPGSEGEGAAKIVAVPLGKVLYCYLTVERDYVLYALVKVQSTLQVGWVRVAEADGTTYFKLLPISPSTAETASLPSAILQGCKAIAQGLTTIAQSLLARK